MKLLNFIFLISIFFLNKSHALIEIDITRGNLDPLPIAVSPLHVDIKSEKYKDLKIVVISALDEISLERALEIGADATLQKPFSNHDLTMVLEQFMSM